jgi:hypothetical protein
MSALPLEDIPPNQSDIGFGSRVIFLSLQETCVDVRIHRNDKTSPRDEQLALYTCSTRQ